MTENDKIENSIIPISSNGIVRVGNSIDITNKIIREYEERSISANYKTIKIVNQEWMTKNLDVDCYKNGDPIPQVQNLKEWEDLTSGAWCYYDNNPENGLKYGKIYNWFAVNDERGLAPNGFKIPSLEDWNILFEKTYERLNVEDIRKKTGLNNIEKFTLMYDHVFFRLRDILIGKDYNVDQFFWTSTERNATNAIHVDFGYQGGGNHDDMFLSEILKNTPSYVRCLKII